MKTYKGFEEAGKHVTNIEELTTRDCEDCEDINTLGNIQTMRG